ncbi:MAG: hypothetical protein A2V90_04340 [Gammaproteobacteria bacterium RBG_16_57_12]|nr:MAG: hypothetical protein A2V90_04340 [Gammaproteobacteria bacterium RBG_16_57_12]
MLNILLATQSTINESRINTLEGARVTVLRAFESPVDIVKRAAVDIVLLEADIEMLRAVKSADPRIEVIMIGATAVDVVAAVREGAYAVFEPLDITTEVVHCLEQIGEQMLVRRETAALEQVLSSKYTFQGIVGRNPNMLEIFNFIRRIAPYFRSVTITGETGTGKERIARALHEESPVADQPFVALNCGGIVRELIESELFGHMKGAFTGALQDKMGLFEAAGQGTLFLDEIGTLPLAVQPHLLRVLQDGSFRRVGSTQPQTARCRIVAAANVDLQEEVKAGRFREDLYFRLAPLTIHLPPLRERKDDIPLLIRYFLERISAKIGKRIAGVSRPAQKALIAYHWPGNVRELENVIERASIMAGESFIQSQDLPPLAAANATASANPALSLEAAVKAHIEAVLSQCQGNRSRAAKRLGISRRSLIRKIDKYQLP